ncbi:M6 family metalloprotease domain-containing protein [candidate division WOR-3 bacterium]|nr:M6 family metalloprotease domain-containing protein [candidate division WOR-3 bacterium]
MKYIAMILSSLIASSIYSMPLNPDLIEELRDEGRLNEIMGVYQDARDRGVNQPNTNAPEWDFTKGRVDQPVLVLLADFSDNEADTFSYPTSHYEDMLFSSGTYPTGSLRDYYLENSYGQLEITGTVSIWFRMPQPYTYYVDGQYGFGLYPHNVQRLVEDVVLAADPLIDFSLFDTDGDSYVDALAVVHAGPGAEWTGNPNDIWSHMWVTHYPILVDGVWVFAYSMDPESGKIGVFGHELGHVFGLPDLYDTDGSSEGLGNWSMMAGGSWGGGGAKPSHFDPWCKKELGFITPEVISTYLPSEVIPAVEFTPCVYKLWTEGTGSNEYFFVENRQKIGFDFYLPGSGILIYHIDEYQPNNNNEYHYKVALEQADGMYHLENNANRGDGGDPFPGTTDNRLFDATTNPSSQGYDGEETYVSVSEISDSDSLMTATLAVILFRPNLKILNYVVDDSHGTGNGDGRADPGEDVGLILEVENRGLDADSVYGLLSTSSPFINITVDSIGFPQIPYGDTVSCNPFEFSVLPESENHLAEFFLEFHAQSNYSKVDTLFLMIGRPPILLVDDDEGKNYEDFYESTLTSLCFLYDRWDVLRDGEPTDVGLYPVLIWFTGDDSTNTLTPSDISEISDYLDGEGDLLLTGQGIGDDIGGTDFYSDYLRASYNGDMPGSYLVHGVPGDVIGDSLELILAGGDGAGNQLSQDAVSPLVDAHKCLNYSGDISAGIRFDSGVFKVVYFGFGFEGINNTHILYSDREDVLKRILSWFGLEVGVEEEIDFQLSILDFRLEIYPNPFREKTVISYQLSVIGNQLITDDWSPITLSIYDLSGRLVRTIPLNLCNPNKSVKSVSWDGRDKNGSSVPAGVYFVRLNINGKEIESGKVVKLGR